MYFGFLIGKAPINDVITFVSEYLPFSNFLEVPVFPPISIPSTIAFCPVPFLTTSAKSLLIFFDVFSFKTLCFLNLSFKLIFG